MRDIRFKNTCTKYNKMNQVFDYNGHVVGPSVPKKVLRTLKKTLHLDSSDRDLTKHYTNGEWIAYLPRSYTNVVSIRLKGATFPRLKKNSSPGALSHSYLNGPNTSSSTYSNDVEITTSPYFLIELVGHNKTDECAIQANGSNYMDGFFAKISSVTSTAVDNSVVVIDYNDHTFEENIASYNPPIETLDRLHIRTRLHSQQGGQGFIYWTTDGGKALASNRSGDGCEYSLTLEIEYLENGFDAFSSYETRLR